MSDKDPFPSQAYAQFRRAKGPVCNRYAILKKLSDTPRSPSVGQKSEKTKSSAQVAPPVGHIVVRQETCGLKPGESRPFKITARFASDERSYLVRQADKACLTLSEYIRASSLGPGYAATIDPVRHQQLIDAIRELNRQGTNLNQIARQLNAGTITAAQGERALALLSGALIAAQRAVREALSEGRTPA